MGVRIKICGLSTPEAIAAAAGADYIGFVFYPPSPRNVTPAKAAELARTSSLPTVAVTVNADDAALDGIFAAFHPTYVQLHGAESPERAATLRKRYNTKIIKAIRIAKTHDIAQAHAYEDSADMLMFDALSPNGLPGGNGASFDWGMLKGHSFACPWFLAGGLHVGNIQEALDKSGASMADISSGVESAPGVKDPAKIHAFITYAKSLSL